MSDLTIAAGPARGLMELAVSKGAGREALLERSGIDPRDLEDQDNRIPFACYVALMRAGKELCRDPALALHFGETVDMSEISIVGLIGRASKSFSDGVAQLNRYARLVVEVDTTAADRFQLVSGEGGVWLVDTRRNPDDFLELTESAFARMASGMRRETGGTAALKAVHVTHADPGYRDEYDRIFQAPVVFESDRNALLIDEALVTPPADVLPRYVFGVLSAHAEALLDGLEKSKSTKGRVESLLMPILHTGDVNMTAVAGKMGLSRHTLFRKLKAEGVTFQQVLDDLRHQMALHYLNGAKVSVNETAYLVGFSEAAAFSRAFKRWTGINPRAARMQAIRGKSS